MLLDQMSLPVPIAAFFIAMSIVKAKPDVFEELKVRMSAVWCWLLKLFIWERSRARKVNLDNGWSKKCHQLLSGPLLIAIRRRIDKRSVIFKMFTISLHPLNTKNSGCKTRPVCSSAFIKGFRDREGNSKEKKRQKNENLGKIKLLAVPNH